jgi:hypothetical protein
MVVSGRPEDAMTPDHLVRLLQMTGAALAIPAAAAGTFAAYQSYFSTDVTCQKLRTDIIGIMERNVDLDTKRSLLKKDVAAFDKLCGEGDPDARAIFQAAMSEHPAQATHAAAAPAPVPTGASSRRAQTAALGVFGALPPAGTVLSAKTMLPVWSEPQAGANDQSKLQSRLPGGACVRVLSTRGGSGRLWAEVAPASCS